MVSCYDFDYCTGAIRKSSPVIVGSLLIQIIALALSTIGNTKKNVKTLIGAVLFISSGRNNILYFIFTSFDSQNKVNVYTGIHICHSI